MKRGQSALDAREVIGLIPAAGHAQRLRALPCSKEIFPLGFSTGDDGIPRPRAACHPLLESFREAGIGKAFVLLRRGKWDIPEFLGSGSDLGVGLAYLALEPTSSVPETLDRAHPFVASADIALGFPDILFEPRDAYRALLARRAESGAQAVLGLFPTDQAWKADMVELDAEDRVRRIVIKDPGCKLRYTWSIAVWGPALTRHLHAFVGGLETGDERREIYVGDVLRSAIEAGLRVEGIRFPHGSFLDIGTPEDLRRAVARFSRNDR